MEKIKHFFRLYLPLFRIALNQKIKSSQHCNDSFFRSKLWLLEAIIYKLITSTGRIRLTFSLSPHSYQPSPSLSNGELQVFIWHTFAFKVWIRIGRERVLNIELLRLLIYMTSGGWEHEYLGVRCRYAYYTKRSYWCMGKSWKRKGTMTDSRRCRT